MQSLSKVLRLRGSWELHSLVSWNNAQLAIPFQGCELDVFNAPHLPIQPGLFQQILLGNIDTSHHREEMVKEQKDTAALDAAIIAAA